MTSLSEHDLGRSKEQLINGKMVTGNTISVHVEDLHPGDVQYDEHGRLFRVFEKVSVPYIMTKKIDEEVKRMAVFISTGESGVTVTIRVFGSHGHPNIEDEDEWTFTAIWDSTSSVTIFRPDYIISELEVPDACP